MPNVVAWILHVPYMYNVVQRTYVDVFLLLVTDRMSLAAEEGPVYFR